MNLRFEGDLSLWQGVALATVVAALIWWVYRREVADSSARVACLLPFFRLSAAVLIVLMLSGPVLHSQVKVGDISRVLVFVDESKSMSLVDRSMSSERKLAIARRLGWFSADFLDTSAIDTTGHLSRVSDASMNLKQILHTLDAGDVDDSLVRVQLESAAKQMMQDLSAARDILSESDAIDALNRQLIHPVQIVIETESGDDPALRSQVDDLLSISELAGEWVDRLRDASAEQAENALVEYNHTPVSDSIDRFDQTTRWQRLEAALCQGDEPLLATLGEKHHVELMTFSGANVGREDSRQLWSLRDGGELPDRLAPNSPAGHATDLVSGLKSEVESHTTDDKLAVVLLTDGQHNATSMPVSSTLQLAKLFGSRGVPVFTVGIGASSPPRDLAVLAVQGPQSVFVDDRVYGEILLHDSIPSGKATTVKVEFDGEIVWQKKIRTQNSRQRIGFDFSIKQLVEDRLAQSTRHVDAVSLPLPMTVSVDAIESETRDDNNSAPFYVRAVTRPRRILLIDGRPRWEFRYVRNLFDRDEQLKVNPVLAVYNAGGDPRIERGSGHGQFPGDRNELFRYDLIVFGDVPRTCFSRNELEWIKQFVSSRGGGLVFIDGRRGKLRDYANSPIGSLLPVEWNGLHSEGPSSARPRNLVLTERGSREAMLRFGGDAATATRQWSELPNPRWIAPAKALPGTETLVEAIIQQVRRPALVLRRVGAGNVLYSAFDESWRWRYEVADLYHQQYWNQLANFAMEPPYAVHDRYVSIDTGGFTFGLDESPDLRVRLRDEQGRPILEATAEAVLYRDDELEATIPLTADENSGGVFRGTSGELREGLYKVAVRATGFNDDQLTARAAFIVEGASHGEMNVLHCDEERLQQMARLSGGEYLREELLGQLPERLQHLSDFRIEDREVVLWRSWWWFAPLMCLFTVEWAIRKRVGLM